MRSACSSIRPRPSNRAQVQRRAGCGACGWSCSSTSFDASTDARSMRRLQPCVSERPARCHRAAMPCSAAASRTDRRAGGAPCAAGDLSVPRVRRGRRPDELRSRVSPMRIARSASTSAAFSRAKSRPTCRSAADQVRAGHQPQDRQGARPRTCRRRCSPAPTR